MNSYKDQYQSYYDKIDEIIRKDRDINFVGIQEEIKIVIDFFIDYYSDDKYRARFTRNEQQDIYRFCHRPFAAAIDAILEVVDWQSAPPDQYRSEIMQAYDHLIQKGYLTRLEAARLTVAKVYDNFESRSKELLAEQEASLGAAKSVTVELFEDLERQRASIDKKIAQIDTIAAEAAKSLAKQVSSESGVVFLEEARKHAKTSFRWLAALIFIAAWAAAMLGWLFLDISLRSEVFGENLVFSGLKVSSILILIYLMQVCSRSYNANKHLEVVNRQRATTIAFINTFMNSVDSEEYKDYLLTYAAKAVFDHGESGFISRNYGAGSNDDGGLDVILTNLSKFNSK